MQSLNKQERISFLENNSLKIDSGNYMKTLSEEEVAARKDGLADTSIRLNDLDEELDKVKDEFKKQMKPLKEQIATLLKDIRHGQTLVSGNLYHLPNHESGYMESYNDEGELINTRKLFPNERQGSVFQIGKTGN